MTNSTYIHGLEAYVECDDCLFPDFFDETFSCDGSIKQGRQLNDLFHLSMLEGIVVTSTHEMPVIEPYNGLIPAEAATFTRARADFNRGTITDYCPCFYQDDSAFMCVINNVDKYIPMLKSYNYVIGLDLSVQMDMPYAVKVNNIFNNKLFTRYLQMKGVCIIPNVVWAEPRLYDICFDGFPQNSVIAVNSMGIKGNRKSVYYWSKGYKEMLKRLTPQHIVRYGEPLAGEDLSISTFCENKHLKRMRQALRYNARKSKGK